MGSEPNNLIGADPNYSTAIIAALESVSGAASGSAAITNLHFEARQGTHDVWVCRYDLNILNDLNVLNEKRKLLVKQLHPHQGQAFTFPSTFELQQRLFAQGLAAEPLYYDEKEQIWIEAYVPKPHSVANDEIHLAHALAQLHQTHQSSAPANDDTVQPLRQLDPVNQCRALIHRLDELPFSKPSIAAHLNEQLDDLVNDMTKAGCGQNDSSWVLCHNDLHIEHLRGDLDKGDYQMVDWEYSAVGPRYFDLASCIAINKLAKPAQTLLLNTYSKLTQLNSVDVTQKTELYLRLVGLINQAWSELVVLSSDN